MLNKSFVVDPVSEITGHKEAAHTEMEYIVPSDQRYGLPEIHHIDEAINHILTYTSPSRTSFLILIQNIKLQFRWISACDEREGSQHFCNIKKTLYQNQWKFVFREWAFILESVLPPKATILPSAWNPTKPGHTPKSAEPPNGPNGSWGRSD